MADESDENPLAGRAGESANAAAGDVDPEEEVPDWLSFAAFAKQVVSPITSHRFRVGSVPVSDSFDRPRFSGSMRTFPDLLVIGTLAGVQAQ